MALSKQMLWFGSSVSIALAFAVGCDKPAAAGAGAGTTSVVRGAPINKPVVATPSATPPAASPAPAPAPSADAPTAAASRAEPDTRTPASPDAVTKSANTAERAAPDATNGAALAKPDRASLVPAMKRPKDDKTAVGTPDKDKPEYLRVNFDELASYDYDPFEAVAPDLGGGTHKVVEADAGPQPAAPVKNSQIPERIMALNKKKIIVQGFMVPIEFKRDAVRSFLLVRNQMMCCFGAMIGMNEWLMVQMDGEKRTSYVQDVPTTVYGELEVGEDIQNGMVMSLYRLRGFEVQFKGGR
jgi:hypothetical protein